MNAEKAFDVVGGFGRYQIFIIAIIFISNFVYAQQMVLMVIVGATPNTSMANEQNLTTIVTEFDLYDEKWVTDLIQSLFMGGYMAGAVFIGQASDLWGRKPALVVSTFLMVIAATFSGLAVSWQTFAVARFFTGFFTGGTGVSVYVLMTELIGRNMWTKIGLSYQCFFSLGIMGLAGVSYAIQNWRTICLVVGGVGFVVIPIFAFLLPESPRWLYSVGKVEKAEAVFRLIAKRNGKNPEDMLDFKLTSIPEENKKSHSIFHVFLHKKLTIWLLAISFIWFTTALVYYGMTLSASDLTPDLYLGVALSGAVEIPATICCIFLMDFKWLGRKGTVLLLFSISLATNISNIFIKESFHTAYLVIGLSTKLVSAGLFAVIYVYTTEIFPAPLRSASLGASSTIARIGAIIASFIPLLLASIPYLPFVIFAATSFVGILSALLLPRTLGKPLAQTVEEAVDKQNYETLINNDDDNQNLLPNGTHEDGQVIA